MDAGSVKAATDPSRSWTIAAAVLALAGVVLPVGATAAWIAGHGGPSGPETTAGLWWWKASWVVAAGALWLLARSKTGSDPATGEGGAPPVERWEVVTLAGILVAAVAVRLVELGTGIWFDEIATWLDYVDAALPAVITTYDSQNNHIFYSVLARVSFQAFGEGVAQLRLPAVAFGVASIAAAWGFARRLVPRTEALLVAGALALSYHHVWFSQNARGYTGLLLFTLLSSSAFLDLLAGRGDPRKGVLRYAAFAALGVYVHLTGVFTVVGHGVAWVVLRLRRGTGDTRWVLAGLVGSAVLSFVAYAPVLPQLLDTVLHDGGFEVRTEWQGLAWLLSETVRGLARGLPGGVVAVVIGLGVALVGTGRLLRARPAATVLMIAPGVVCTVALVATSHNLWPRFYFFLAGFAVMIAIHGGVGIVRMMLGPRRGERVGWALAAAAVVVGGALVPRAWAPKQDFGSAARWIDDLVGPANGVATAGLTARPFREFMARDWPEVATADDLRALEARAEVVRVLVTIPVQLEAAHPDLAERLASEYVEEQRFSGSVAGGDIVVYRRGQP